MFDELPIEIVKIIINYAFNHKNYCIRDNLAIMRLMLSIPGVYRYLCKNPEFRLRNVVFSPGKLCKKDKYVENSELTNYPRDINVLLYKHSISHCEGESEVCYECLSIINYGSKPFRVKFCEWCDITICHKCIIPGALQIRKYSNIELCDNCLPYYKFLYPDTL